MLASGSNQAAIPNEPRTAGLSSRKPFDMADLAAAALARPRAVEPWAERDDLADCPSSPSSSGSASPYLRSPTSPWSEATSCAMTPSSSAGSFCLPPPLAAPPAAVPRRRIAPSSSLPALSSQLPPLPSPQRPLPRTISAPALPPIAPADPWHGADFSLKLLFTPTNAGGARSTPAADDSLENTLPPAFFPSQRISFSPRLRIASADGLAFSSLGGMHLGVTGMCEVLDERGIVKSQRMIADFCIDLSSGLRVWKRDAEAAATARKQDGAINSDDVRLPPGTYVLPLSMKVPNSDRLPPSYECAQFRITYTMSIALFSAAKNSNGTPRRLKVFSVPFHVLPSTLPVPAPELPTLTHDHKKGVFESLMRSFSFSTPKINETGFHTIIPSMPTSHYSPGAASAVPVSLRIIDRPLEPTDLYVRLAIVRKVYVRESTRVSLDRAIEERWGLDEGVPVATLGYPEEMLVEPWCVEEEEVVSRWAWIPYSARSGADPEEENEVELKNIMLPLCGADGRGWTHGYSSTLDLEPSAVPAMTHGDCSWFSPAFRTRAPVAKEYDQHVHVSSRFYLAMEIGFAPPTLRDTLAHLHRQTPDMPIPQPFEFTAPTAPATSVYSGLSTSNPFFVPSSRSAPAQQSTPASPLAFPGKLRELLIPLTIGSVAEPGLACLGGQATSHAESEARRRDREAREERGEDARAIHGEGEEGAWLCAPPDYTEALETAPAYL